jgi:ketosteroid isomerase-like protein
MSEENVEVVRRMAELAQEAIQRGDPGAGFDQCFAEGLIASNIEWRAGPRGGTGVAGLGDFVGREGYVRFARILTDEFDDVKTEFERFIDAGDDGVLALVHSSGIGRESRAPVEIRVAYLFKLEAGCVVEVVPFLRREDAFKALGLSE